MKKTELHKEIRERYLAKVAELLTNMGDEVLRTKSNEIAVPTLDAEGGEEYVVITFKVPTGDRSGEAYDGYAAAEGYEIALKEKAEKEKARKAKAEQRKAKQKPKEDVKG